MIFLWKCFCTFCYASSPLQAGEMRFRCFPSLSSRAARCHTVPTIPAALAVVCVHKLGCAFLFFAYCTVRVFVHAVPLNSLKMSKTTNEKMKKIKRTCKRAKKQQKTLQFTCQWLRPFSQCTLRCALACPSANEQENWVSWHESCHERAESIRAAAV